MKLMSRAIGEFGGGPSLCRHNQGSRASATIGQRGQRTDAIVWQGCKGLLFPEEWSEAFAKTGGGSENASGNKIEQPHHARSWPLTSEGDLSDHHRATFRIRDFQRWRRRRSAAVRMEHKLVDDQRIVEANRSRLMPRKAACELPTVYNGTTSSGRSICSGQRGTSDRSYLGATW